MKDLLPMKASLEQMDRMRQRRGKALDAAGFAPVETPSRILHEEAGVRLRRYGNGDNAAGPVMLIVPAPIKRHYIWDLAPEVSVVKRCIDQGMRVYLAEWIAPTDAEKHFDLADYGNRLLDACARAIEADSNEKQFIVAGHSLGGILATIFACMHPQRVRALVLLETPLHFGADAGDFAPLIAATPDARPIAEAFGTVPGSFLNLVSVKAAPQAFQWERLIDRSWSLINPAAYRTHMRVERWTCDESPLPGKLFVDIVERLYRNDELTQGTLFITDRQIGPSAVRAPLLTVIDPRSSVIPPQSTLPFHEAAASPTKKVLEYRGDIGVGIQHVGVLVGANGHEKIWPAIFGWLEEVGGLQRQ